MKKEMNVDKMEEEFNQWTKKLDTFETTAHTSNGWSKIDVRQRIDDLKVKRALVRTKLDEFKVTKKNRQESVMIALTLAWSDFETAFNELVH